VVEYGTGGWYVLLPHDRKAVANMSFKPVSSAVAFPEVERDILSFWNAGEIFRKSLDLRRSAREYVFYDGPPFATGLPHYGHLLAGTIKDIVPRYHTMRGHFVDRRFGWDCHGLPVEYEVEQSLNISGKSDIEKMGVGVFNEKCRGIVLRYTEEWRKTVTRMGRWVDFDRDYKTMDPKYMESIWWVFKSLWEKDLIYEGQKILPYCPRCATPLSNFETNQGYEDVTDPAITVRFRLEGEENAYLLAWTTTPWTLPSNMALAVGEDIEYARVLDKGTVYYLAAARFGQYYRKPDQYQAKTSLKGRDLVGRRYEPLFPYFADRKGEGAFRVIAADFVSTEDGTGVVHVAPGFGEDDYRVGMQQGIPAVCPMDDEGRFTADVPDYAGRAVKEADADIMQRLKKEGALIHRGTIVHPYPHCWRCDTPLLYRGISTWFVRVERIKERLLAANSAIHWVPEHLRDGRFGKWLEGARDWAISRNRYWGTPLPVWRSADRTETLCVGSIAELERLTGGKVADLHKHFVDGMTIMSPKTGVELRRIPEVLDCWFESGAMPYAQAHYPFENKEHFESHFPADFIAEGLDQTRGWFYTLTVLSSALFDKPAFRNVVVNGLVLAADGKKMSKRLKNYPDPEKIIETYGADAVRLYMLNSAVVRAEDLRFSEEGVKQLSRHLLIPLWNAYSFFVTYANVDGWTTERALREVSPNVLDRWIRSSFETLVADVTAAMDDYDLQRAVRPFVAFIEDLTNWYIRRSRRRFWKSQDDDDKAHAYTTLYNVLLGLSKVAAPFVPFVSEAIYRNLRTEGMPESVHLCDFPTTNESMRDAALESEMATAMTVVRLGRQLRAQHDLKVRQPLAAIYVVSRNPEVRRQVGAYRDLINDELNVKDMVVDHRETRLANLKAKADFRRLGPKLGPNMKRTAGQITELPEGVIDAILGGSPVSMGITPNGESLQVTAEDLVVERIPRPGLVVASEGDIVVALDEKLTPELTREGLAREFVNKVQNMRKDAGLDVSQRIRVSFAADDEVASAVSAHREYVCAETLTLDLRREGAVPAGGTEWDLNGHACTIALSAV
jgi:isoleucyl-tRNA synthetase